VIEKILEEKKDSKKRRLYIEFIEMFTTDTLKNGQDDFRNLPVDVVISILKSDKLTAKEVDIFDAAVGWGKAELKRESKKTEEKSRLSDVMKDVLPHIRFPVMEMADVATKVTTSGLLSNEQILALYTFIGSRPADGSTDKLKLPSALSAFNAKARKGSTRCPKWDNSQTWTYAVYALSNNNRTAIKSSQDGTIYIIRETEPRDKGVHVIRVRCDAVGRFDNYNNDAIGFANDSYPWTNATLNSGGALFVNGSGQLFVDNSQRQTGLFNASPGMILTFVLDMNKRTVSVQSNNGSSTQVEWSSMGQRVYFAMCFRYVGWQWTCLE